MKRRNFMGLLPALVAGFTAIKVALPQRIRLNYSTPRNWPRVQFRMRTMAMDRSHIMTDAEIEYYIGEIQRMSNDLA